MTREEPLVKESRTLVKDLVEDAISRQTVLDKIKEVCFSKKQEWVDFRVSQGSNGQRDFIIKFIEDLPSVQPEPKTGHWIWCGGSHKCSNCEEYTCFSHKKPPRYCPNCGARMVESEDTETWNGIHAQITAPKGTFEKIFNDADDDNDI